MREVKLVNGGSKVSKPATPPKVHKAKDCNKPNCIHTCDDKFHTGMTADQAKKAGTFDSKAWYESGYGFEDIDKNKDGVLSDKEICDQRDKEVKKEKVFGYAGGAIGAVSSVAGVATGVATFGAGTPVGAGFLVNGTLMITNAALGLNEAANNQDKTDEYRRKHNIK